MALASLWTEVELRFRFRREHLQVMVMDALQGQLKTGWLAWVLGQGWWVYKVR